MKRILIFIILILLSETAFSQSSSYVASKKKKKSTVVSRSSRSKSRRYKVSVNSEVNFLPDTVWLICGINTEGFNIKTACDENRKIYSKVKRLFEQKEFNKYIKLIFEPITNIKESMNKDHREYSIERWIILERREIKSENIEEVMSDISIFIDKLNSAGVNMWGDPGSSKKDAMTFFGCLHYKQYERRACLAGLKKLEKQKEEDEKSMGVILTPDRSKPRFQGFRPSVSSSSVFSMLPSCPKTTRYEEIPVKVSIYSYYNISDRSPAKPHKAVERRNTTGLKNSIKEFDYSTEGFLDNDTFQVIAEGTWPEEDSAARRVIKRNKAKEKALIKAQARVKELFKGYALKVNQGRDPNKTALKLIEGYSRGGSIIKTTYNEVDNCTIVYRVYSIGLKRMTESGFE